MVKLLLKKLISSLRSRRMFVKLGMDDEAKSYIKSFLNSPAYIDVPGLQDIQADFVPEQQDLQSMIAWSRSRAGDPLADYLSKVVAPACLMAIRRQGENPVAVKTIRMQDSDNVHAIAGAMEMAMSQPTQPLQQSPQQPTDEADGRPNTVDQPSAHPTPMAGIAALGSLPIDNILGLDNYTKGIERLVTAEVRKRVKEAEKIHKLELIEKNAIIARLTAELARIKSAVNSAET
jgi:hypothetical protein